MPRNAAQWNRTPPLPPTHYVDPLVYTSEEILAQEREKIFARAWSIACHESEVPERYDYRTYRHPAGKNLMVVRGDDGTIRTFFNVCPHRGNTILYNPAGNAKHLLCIFHAFAFDCRGRQLNSKSWSERCRVNIGKIRSEQNDFAQSAGMRKGVSSGSHQVREGDCREVPIRDEGAHD